jgi:glycogen debranching enzyme
MFTIETSAHANHAVGRKENQMRAVQIRRSLALSLVLAAGVALPTVERLAADEISIWLPSLKTDQRVVNDAFRIAIGDLFGNVSLFQDGLLEAPAPVILAGLDYGTPWTRDASINAWNGASLIMPHAARNTLLSVLDRTDNGLRIGGQYWDCIVWATGAWHHYLYTGDQAFLAIALEATRNSLTHLEQTEFDATDNLFRGPGWSDGVAGYPVEYADSGGSSAILDWPKHNSDAVSHPGYGIPMKALSTNCLYYHAYVVAEKMARALSLPPDPLWAPKAKAMKEAINRAFWIDETAYYRFLVGPFGPCNHQEGLGHSYALLFGIASARQSESIFTNMHIAPAGIPCAWPSFARYDSTDGQSFARHAGTVWPQIQGFWAEAAARSGKTDVFAHELFNLAKHANRDRQFAEIYHPLSGEIYGGMQEASDKGIILWEATRRQTWAATAYIRMIMLGLVGMRFDREGVQFRPCVPETISYVELDNVKYRNMRLKITVRGSGSKIKNCTINGKEVPAAAIGAAQTGRQEVVIELQ